jgi:hypothetical protein
MDEWQTFSLRGLDGTKKRTWAFCSRHVSAQQHGFCYPICAMDIRDCMYGIDPLQQAGMLACCSDAVMHVAVMFVMVYACMDDTSGLDGLGE